jgi:hypothetical protein
MYSHNTTTPDLYLLREETFIVHTCLVGKVFYFFRQNIGEQSLPVVVQSIDLTRSSKAFVAVQSYLCLGF